MKLKYIAVLFVLSILSISCEREDETKLGVSVFDGIHDESNLGMFLQAVEKTKLREVLSGTQYTVLAPTNQAFIDAGINISTMESSELLEILKYHIIPSRVDSSLFSLDFAFLNGQLAPSASIANNWIGGLTYQGYQTLNLNVNANVYVTQAIEVLDNTNGKLQGKGVFFNGSPVADLDTFEGADGVVHKIDRVLLPPTGNIGKIVASTTDLSLFNKLIEKASFAGFSSDTLTRFPASSTSRTRTGTLTVLAPTNSAMQAEGLDESAINALTPAAAHVIARHHVVNLRYFSSDLNNLLFRNNPAVTTFTLGTQVTGFNVVYNNNSGTPFFSSTGTANARIIKSDIVATNGVLYKIDAVLK